MKTIKFALRAFLVAVLALAIYGLGTNPENAQALALNGSVEELRGVWIATVDNIDMTKQSANTASGIEAYKEQFRKKLDTVEQYGMNAVFFQVRPCNDAFYPSEYNSISQFLITATTELTWDPLEWMIEEAHSRGIQFHAWLNPYRTSRSTGVTFNSSAADIKKAKETLAGQYIARGLKNNPVMDTENPDFYENIVLGKENLFVLNPARQVTIDHVVNTIDEIIQNYQVDGIHFDDYFYPSGGIETAIDTKDYNAYVNAGGTLSKEDWRRDNVNRLIEEISELVDDYNDESDNYVAFGISPCAIWAPTPDKCTGTDKIRADVNGMAVGCGSYSAYADLFADTRKWVVEEWVDYIIPQNYFHVTAPEYSIVNYWWANLIKSNNLDVKLFIGTAIYRLEEWKNGTVVEDEMKQVESNALVSEVTDGYVMFSMRTFYATDSYTKTGVGNYLFTRWKAGALAPKYRHVADAGTESAVPTVFSYKNSNTFIISIPQVEKASGYAVYRFNKNDPIDFTKKPSKVFLQGEEDKVHQYTRTNDNEYMNYTLVVVTFDMNNQPLPNYQVVNYNSMQINQGPSVEFVSTLETEYEVGTAVSVKVNVSHTNGLPVTVQAAYSTGEEYESPRNMVSEGGGNYYLNRSLNILGEDHDFKIIVSDGDITVEIISTSFTVKEEETVTPPPTPNPSTGCNFGSAIALSMSAIGLVVVIWKKRDN